MRFTWDETKRLANLRKHGLDFADAPRVVAGELYRRLDDRFDYDEVRLIAIGILDALVVIVAHIERDETIRVISMRKANKHETQIYFEEIHSG